MNHEEKHYQDGIEIPTVNDVKKLDEYFWEGFDACLEMVLNSLGSQENNKIAKFTVWDFIEDFKEHLIEEAELYKTDG